MGSKEGRGLVTALNADTQRAHHPQKTGRTIQPKPAKAWRQAVAHPAKGMAMLEVTVKLKVTYAQLRALLVLLVLIFT
jgi:hypothetical protein